MPIPSSVEDLDPAEANNSPGGSEPIGQNLDSYLRAHAAILRQVSDASKVETQIHGAPSKATPVDADELPIADSEASFGRKKLTLANLKAALNTYFDTLYLKLSGGTMTGLLKFAAGANIASAATVDLSTATGNTTHITGTTGISGWTMTAGQVMDLIFDGVLTLTHHATNNNLPSAANITTEAGDRARYFYDGTTVYCLYYVRKSGIALVKSGPLTDEYVSPQQTITSGGSLTLSAGFAPKFVTAELVCVTSGNNYTAGNIVQIATTQQSTDAHLNCGLNVEKSGSSIFVRFGSNPNVFMMGDKNSGVGTTVPNANWRLVVRAFG